MLQRDGLLARAGVDLVRRKLGARNMPLSTEEKDESTLLGLDTLVVLSVLLVPQLLGKNRLRLFREDLVCVTQGVFVVSPALHGLQASSLVKLC